MNILKIVNEKLSMTFEDGFLLNNHPILFHLVPLGTVTLYFLMVKYLPGFLQNYYEPPDPKKVRLKNDVKKQPSMLEIVMFCHNMFNSAVSAWGITYGGFYYAGIIMKMGFLNTICDPEGVVSHTPNPLNFICLVYVFTKFIELLDTFFLIVKNPYREVYFLHWYHHITVLLFSYYSYHMKVSISIVFGMINGLIHMFMYYYYAVAIVSKPPTWGKYMMMGQMTQMVLALFAFVYFNYRFFGTDDSCYMSIRTVPLFNMLPERTVKLMWFFYCYVMYASYLYLFASMFVKRFILKKSYKKVKGK